MGDRKTNETQNGAGSDWYIRNFDPATSDPPTVETELRRLQILKDYSILDVDPMPCYDRFTAFAAHAFNCPAAIISLVDLGRSWCLSAYGVPENVPKQYPRQHAISSHNILARDGQLIVEDTLMDSRFSSFPFVVEHPFLRFYAGASLISPEGFKIGTIAVLDWTPQQWTNEKCELLHDLAALLMDLMNEHRQKAKQPVPVSGSMDRANPTFRSVCDSLSTLLSDHELQHSMTSTQKFTLKSALQNLRAVAAATSHSNEVTTAHVYHGTGNRGPSVSVSIVEFTEFGRNVELAIGSFDARRVPFWVDLHHSLPLRAMFNDLVVFRATIALVTSACERTREGFVCLRIMLFSPEGGRPFILFECEDTAPYISPSVRSRLFSPPSFTHDDYYSCTDDNCLLDGQRSAGNHVAADVMAQLESLRPLSSGQSEDTGENSNSEDKSERSDAFRLYPVAKYMESVGGGYGCREKSDETGSILWVRIPLVLPDGDQNP